MKKSISTTKDRFWVGIDDHAATIVVAVLRNEEAGPVERFTVGTDEKGDKELIKRLKALKGEVAVAKKARKAGTAKLQKADAATLDRVAT